MIKISDVKNYYTTNELVQQPWFPIKSTITLKKLIERGMLNGVDISTNPRFRRYRIDKESVINFLVRKEEEKVKKVLKIK